MLSFLWGGGFDINKLRPHLKMAVQRIGIAVNKKTASIKIAQREVARLLAEGKEEKAAIKVEAIIREDATIEALGIIELLCDLVHERARLLAAEKECPEDLKPPVQTLIWAANRADVAELHEVKKQFVRKYGREWVERAEQDAERLVNERVVHKLGIRPPSAALVQKYLLEIARAHNVEWTPTERPGLTDEQMAWQSMPAPTGASVPMAPGTNFGGLYSNQPPQLPPPPTPPGGKGDGGNGGGGGGGGAIPVAPSTMPVATPVVPPHTSGGKEGFMPPPPAPHASHQQPLPSPPVVAAVPLDAPPFPPSAPANDEEDEGPSAVYDIPLPPSQPPTLPAPDLPPAPATSGSGDDHLGISGGSSGRGTRGGSGSGPPDVEDLESRFNRLKGR